MAVDGREVAAEALVHLMLHKPAGVVTTSDDPQGRRTVLDLVDVPSGCSRWGGSTTPPRDCCC